MSQVKTLRKFISGSLIGGIGLLAAPSALPFAFELGEFEGAVDNQISLGARWRIQDRDNTQISKLNVDPSLCPRDSVGCLISGHQEFVDASGGFNPNADNGNLNYDQWDIGQGVAKITTDFSISWGNYGAFVRGYAFYDFANDDFNEFHADGFNTEDIANGGDGSGADGATRGSGGDQPPPSATAFQPRYSKRTRDVEDESVFRREILDAYVYADFEFGDYVLGVRYGEQVISWGESLLLAVGSLNTINPPSVTRLFTPGLDLKEIFGAVELLQATINVTENLSLEGWYQFDFERADVNSAGTFLSTLDIAQAGGTYAMLSFGKAHEDPSNSADTLSAAEFASGARPEDDAINEGCVNPATVTAGLNAKEQFNSESAAAAVDGTSGVPNAERGGTFGRTICVLDQEDFFPDSGGQYGIKASYYSEAINDTEFGFYYARYHSRFPLAGAFAANDNPLAGLPVADVLAAINGTPLGALVSAIPIPDPDLVPVVGALGVADSLSLVLTYPKDIKMYGISFNTNIGDLSVSGEYAYRENLPLQILSADLVSAGESTAFVSSRKQALPPCLELYRNPNYNGVCVDENGQVPDEAQAILAQAPMGRFQDDPNDPNFSRSFDRYLEGNPSEWDTFREVRPGDFIPGWERFHAGQGDLVMLYSAPPALWGADQWILVVEVGFTNIFGMPDPDVLPLNGPNTDTHLLVGRANCEALIGTGNECYGDATAAPLPDGTTTTATSLAIQNPVSQTDGFPTSFSWGIRQLNLLSYNNLFAGFNLQLIVGLFYDVNGISPGPGGNFVEDRKQWLMIGNFSRGAWTYTLGWSGSTGAGDQNVTRDRDNFQLGVKYQF